MNIEKFTQKYSGQQQPIQDILKAWNNQDIDLTLDELAFGSVILTDALQGDGVSDRIPPDLLEALNHVYQSRDIETYGDARELLRELLDKDDKAIMGFVSKIKGQIGENRFIEASEGKAQLASSINQEGWDVAVSHDDYTQFVQVKTLSDPTQVIDKMLSVNEKVLAGKITDENGAIIQQIDFAIPHDIIDKVTELKEQHQAIAHMDLIPLSITAQEAGEIVSEGLNNLGPNATAHLFDQLLAGLVVPAAIVATINAFHVIKKNQEVHEAITGTLGSVALTGVGYGSALTSEVALDRILDVMLGPVSATIGIATRVFLKRGIEARLKTALSIKDQYKKLSSQAKHIQSIGSTPSNVNYA